MRKTTIQKHLDEQRLAHKVRNTSAKQVPEPAVDKLVNHPAHYNKHPAGIEAIKIIQHFSFNVGTAVKHLWRAGLKGDSLADKLRDLHKAREYIDFEIERVKEFEQ